MTWTGWNLSSEERWRSPCYRLQASTTVDLMSSCPSTLSDMSLFGIAMVLVECELRGGHELRKQNGEYVCLSCNTRYTLEEARKLVKKEQKVASSPKEIVPEAKEKALLEDYPELMRAEHVAHVMGVSKQAVYRMSREEQIPSVVIGSRIFFPRQRFLEFLEYLESQKRQSNDRS